MVQVAVEELDGELLPAIGELDETTWDAVRGGQPVALTRRGRPVAVVVDAESYAEMFNAAHASEAPS